MATHSRRRFRITIFTVYFMMISIIVAIAQNNAIGYQNKLLYWLPDDLKRFKALTTGHTIIMGRKTFESLPKGALPNRLNIVLSHNQDFTAPNTELYHSLEEALAHCKDEEQIYIIGGESVYREALPLAQRLYITEVEDMPDKADAFFPSLSAHEWELTETIPHETDEKHTHRFAFKDYVRK